jgi:hypothetical protein
MEDVEELGDNTIKSLITLDISRETKTLDYIKSKNFY